MRLCRICKTETEKLFSLGDFYVSTFVDKMGENVGKAPMTLVKCPECSLVQLNETFNLTTLYKEHYWYKSSINKVIVDDLKDIVKKASELVEIKNNDIWLDIGANDGTLLKFVPSEFIKIACEPAENLIPEVRNHCDMLIPDFWSYYKYKNLFTGDVSKKSIKSKVITAIGMFYDMEDPNQFVRDVAYALDSKGIFIAQLMTLKPMMENNDLGNICHEHLEFYNYKSLVYLFEQNNLEIFKVEENEINGGSYRLYARKLKNGSISYPEKEYDFDKFYKSICKNRNDVLAFINKCNQHKEKVYCYGASTKGNTILQFYGLSNNSIKGVIDVNWEKFGKLTVGTWIPVVSGDSLKYADWCLILPWGFTKDFIIKESEWLKKGGKFISHTPEFKIWETKDL